MVSIHAPARGATCRVEHRHRPDQFVSIHAPARGATLRERAAVQSTIPVSIHAPARGATSQLIAARRRSYEFQSTPPRGGRRLSQWPGPGHGHSFNPRPRAGGDTARRVLYIGPWYQFQSTPPRGGRLIIGSGNNIQSWFQSTPPRGGRHAQLRGSATSGCRFNPRPRAGGDHGSSHRCSSMVSIHAPARGATVRPDHTARASFNPRPRAGGDCTSKKLHNINSQSTLQREEVHNLYKKTFSRKEKELYYYKINTLNRLRTAQKNHVRLGFAHLLLL